MPSTLNPGAIATNPQNQETFADLLNRGRQQLATQLIDQPTSLDRLADFAQLYASSQAQGVQGFNAAKQQQVENQRAQQEQLQQLLEHEDNLSIQERQHQRLMLKDLHDRLKANGETSAAAAEQLTNGNANDIYKLHQNYAKFLQSQGIDDDQLSPQEIINWYANDYARGIAAGEYEGPTREMQARSPGDILYGPTGEQEGTVPWAPGMSPEDEQQRKLQLQADEWARRAALEQLKAELDASTGEGAKPDNYLLPDGRTVLSYDHKTYIDPNTKEQGVIPSNSIRLGRETAASEARAAKYAATARDEVNKNLQPQTKSMVTAALEGGIGPWSKLKAALDAVVGGSNIGKVFGYEEGSLFPKTTDNRQYLKTLRQLGKAALVNNDRFPIAEQRLVDGLLPDPDEFWRNPSTSARNVIQLKNILQSWQNANNKTIASGILDPKTLGELVAKNSEIDRLLQFMGPSGTAVAPESRAITPPIGTVEEGYRFKGGDPSKPESWEKVE